MTHSEFWSYFDIQEIIPTDISEIQMDKWILQMVTWNFFVFCLLISTFLFDYR